MSGLILPKRFRQQPTGPIRLREDGIAQSVILAAPLRQPGEIITRRLGQIIPVETGVGRVVGPQGVAANFNGSVQINLGTAPILEAGKPFSFCLRIKATSASAYGAPLCLRYGTTGLLFIRGTATDYYATIGPIQGGGSTPRNFVSAGPATAGVDEFWVVTNASGPETASGYTAYLNGVGLTYVSSSFGSGTATTSYIGWDGFDTKWSGPIQDLVVWDRALSPYEAREISYNPWLIYETKPRPVYFSAAAGAGIAPATGGYTYTGNTPAISQPRTVAPSSGAYTVAGNTPTISQPRTVAPSSGAYTVAGNTPTISQPRTLAPAVGSYAYLGNAPEVSQIAGIRPTTGGYVYTGNTPSISQPRTIAPLEGAYAYAGNTPSVSQSAGVSLSPEDLAAIADAVWADSVAVAAHAKLDAILARLTC